MFAKAILLIVGAIASADAFVNPMGSSALSRAGFRAGAVSSSRRPASLALRMQQSPIKLTPKLFSELDTDNSGTISAAEVPDFES